MSSIFPPKNQGKNRAFFSLIFVHFTPRNHNILWSEWLIYRFCHNVSSESQFQRGQTLQTYPVDLSAWVMVKGIDQEVTVKDEIPLTEGDLKIILAVTDSYGQSYTVTVEWWRISKNETTGAITAEMVDPDTGLVW